MMELKLSFCTIQFLGNTPYNRTMMELKLDLFEG